MPRPPQGVHPLAAAMEWVARITAAALMMVLPGLGGQWIDRRLGWSVFTLLGFLIGLVGGVGYLLAVTRKTSDSESVARPGNRRDRDDDATQP